VLFTDPRSRHRQPPKPDSLPRGSSPRDVARPRCSPRFVARQRAAIRSTSLSASSRFRSPEAQRCTSFRHCRQRCWSRAVLAFGYYIRSATSEDGGILQRWKAYAKNPSGGNVDRRQALIARATDTKNWQFTILQNLPRTMTPTEVVGVERLYKESWGLAPTGGTRIKRRQISCSRGELVSR
jgi:hypothetical protein